MYLFLYEHLLMKAMTKTSQANGVILGSGKQEVSRVTLQAIALSPIVKS